MSRCTTFFEPFPEQRLQFRIIPRAEESMSSGVNLSVEGGGSSSVSNPSSETQNLFGNYPNASCVEILREEQTPCLIMNKEKDVVVQNANDSKANKKLLPTENFKSKNLHSERKRRERINQAMYGLRAVVPKITKVSSETQCSFWITLLVVNVALSIGLLYLSFFVLYAVEQNWNFQ